MIEYQTLKKLVLEVLKKTPDLHDNIIQNEVEKLVIQYKVFPSKEECQERKIDYSYYARGQLNPIDKLNINQIVWDLIIDRVLTIGKDISNLEWGWLRLTDFGRTLVEETTQLYYDPEKYGLVLDSITNIDPIIKQYAVEGISCFRQRLFFAAAVMFGAAAEKAVLLLLESITNAETDPKKKSNLTKLLDRPNLPDIFSVIQSILESLIQKKKIPYSAYQGSTEHLLSLFEMIRTQRNDAVHPAVGQVNKIKVFLVTQTLPAALEVVYRLIEWFNNNKI